MVLIAGAASILTAYTPKAEEAPADNTTSAEETTTKPTTAKTITTEPTTAPSSTAKLEPININLNPKTDEELVRSGGEFVLRLLWDGLPVDENDSTNDEYGNKLYPLASEWKLQSKKKLDEAFSKLFSKKSQKALTDQYSSENYSPMNVLAYKDQIIPQQLLHKFQLTEINSKLYQYSQWYSQHDFAKLKAKKTSTDSWLIAVPLKDLEDKEKLSSLQDLFLLTLQDNKIDSIRWIGRRALKDEFPSTNELTDLLPADEQIYNKLRIALTWRFATHALPSDFIYEFLDPKDPRYRYTKVDPVLGLKSVDALKKKLNDHLAPNMYQFDETRYKTINNALYRIDSGTSYEWPTWTCVALWFVSEKDGVTTYRFDSTTSSFGEDFASSNTVTFKDGKLTSMEAIK
jgi:hypothetical protein